MPLIGSVADDLTGATTTGVLLARSKARTAVFFNVEAAMKAEGVDELDAIIISSNSRPLPANEAYDKVKDATIALKSMGARYFQKRIDGVALINTPVAQDVRTPVKENYVPRLLEGQTRRKVGLVTLDKVLAGDEAIKEALAKERADGCQVIVVDAITLEDVENIAQACISLNWDVVSVDPGPFTSKLAYYRDIIGVEEPNLPPQGDETGKTVLIAAGSATPVTKKQMEILCQDERHVRISVEPIPLIDGGEAALDEVYKAVNKAVALMKAAVPPRAILFETALHGELLNLDEEDAKRHYAGGMSANRINAGLGTIIQQVLEVVGKDKVAGLYTTGGDTMVNVCYQLGVECIEVLDYVIPQTDIGRLIGSPYSGLPVVGKGGLTGNDNTACDIVTRLFNEAARK